MAAVIGVCIWNSGTEIGRANRAGKQDEPAAAAGWSSAIASRAARCSGREAGRRQAKIAPAMGR